jgi:hypothetical protein
MPETSARPQREDAVDDALPRYARLKPMRFSTLYPDGSGTVIPRSRLTHCLHTPEFLVNFP